MIQGSFSPTLAHTIPDEVTISEIRRISPTAVLHYLVSPTNS